MYIVNGSDLTAVANSIRQKGGTSAPLAFPSGFVNAIAAIQAGSGSGSGEGEILGENKTGNLISQMLYHITSGEYVHGKFTLATALPTAETLIFDSGLEKIDGFAIVNMDWDGTFESGKERTAFGAALINPDAGHTEWINAEKTPFLYHYCFAMSSQGSYAITQYNNYVSPLRQAQRIRIDGGAFYAEAHYNASENYTPFAPGMEYLWIAW